MAEIERRISIRDPFGVQIGVIGTGPLVEMFTGVRPFITSIREGKLLDLLRDPQAVLNQTDLEELSAGLDFNDKENLVEVTEGLQLEYFINAGAQGTLALKRAGTQVDGTTVRDGEIYAVFGVAASLDAGAAVPIVLPQGITVSPGVRGGVSLEIRNYRRYSAQESALDIVRAAIGEFRFPFNPDSVAQLEEGNFITYRLDGRLAVTTEVSWGMTTNVLLDRLADLDNLSPDLKRADVFGSGFDLGVHVAAEATVEFLHGFSDEFDFKVKKKAGSLVALSVSKAREKQSEAGFDFTVGAAPGVGPNVRREVTRFLTSRLQGLSDEQTANLTDRLFDATQNALVRRANIEFSTSYREIDREDVLFEFDFDLEKAEARRAYLKAAEGDLTVAQAAVRKPNSGVRLRHTLTEKLSQKTLDVALNLLGVFSFKSVEELAKKSVIEVDEAGEVSIYHQSTYKTKSQTSLGHLKMADFLFKVAWNRGQGDGANEKDFDFTLLYTFHEKDRFTSRRELTDVLNLAVALGVMNEAKKQEILTVPVEFRRALTWPILGLLSPESTYGRSSVLIQSSFSEAGLSFVLEHEDPEIWNTYGHAYRVANPRSAATDWMVPEVRKTIDREGWANYVNVADSSRRFHRHAVITEYQKAKQLVMTLRVFRQAIHSGKKGQALIRLMSKAGKAAKNFHFDRAAFLALTLLCKPEGRKTSLVIEGDKINATFPMSE